MEATNITKNKITVAFSPEELAFLSNAINEALEAVEEWEFQTRTGETRKRAMEVQTQLREILNEAKQIYDRNLSARTTMADWSRYPANLPK